MNDYSISIWTVVFLLAAFGWYVLPATIGSKRGVCGSGWLLLLNLLAGWTVLGWIVCLIWAVSGQTRAADAFYRAQAAK